MTEQKQYTGITAPIQRWLGGVTEKDITKGALIVLLEGIFAGGAAYSAASMITLPVAGLAGTVQAIAAVSGIVMTLLVWVVSSLIFHGVAHLLGGRGNRNRMFALAGYASVPQLIQQLIRFVSYWFLGQTATTSGTGIIELLLQYFNVFSIIGLVLMSLAIMTNYKLPGKKAILVALIPSFIGLAFGFAALAMVRSTASTSTASIGLFRRSTSG